MGKILRIKKIRTIAHKPIRKISSAPPAGSHIEKHEYDATSKALTVTFRGGRKYRYDGIDTKTAEGLANASSKGAFMRASVLGKFSATKL